MTTKKKSPSVSKPSKINEKSLVKDQNNLEKIENAILEEEHKIEEKLDMVLYQTLLLPKHMFDSAKMQFFVSMILVILLIIQLYLFIGIHELIKTSLLSNFAV